MKKWFLIPLAALLLVQPPARAQEHAAGLVTFAQGGLDIETSKGRRHFTVELASTPDQRVQGLMYRLHLASDAGMLFDNGAQTVMSMWMKNTFIPLDMLFIDADGRIASIHQRAVPESTAIISSGKAVRGVLELNGGTAEALGIKPGDRIVHPWFGAVQK